MLVLNHVKPARSLSTTGGDARSSTTEKVEDDVMAGNVSRTGATVTSRALALIGAYDSRHRRLSLTQLAERADLPVPTAHRLVGRAASSGAR